MARNGRKMAIYEPKIFSFFSYKIEKTGNKEGNVFSLVVFDPIKINSRLATQNVHQNLTFVKDINVVCEKMNRNCRKIVPKPICALHFRYVFSKFHSWFLFLLLFWEAIIESCVMYKEFPFS